MPASLFPSQAELLRFLPEIILSVAGTLVMMLDAVTGGRQPKLFGHLTIGAFVAALFATVAASADPGYSFSSMVVVADRRVRDGGRRQIPSFADVRAMYLTSN